uniref:Plac8 onzin related protein 6 n=1 Tax=Oryzias melastigma TaxID=30732 RepID=A0A3B3BMG6_ORYME
PRLWICSRSVYAMAARTETEWNTALLDCFEDPRTCCYGFWCGPCLACTVSGRFRELYCLPACDVLALLSQLMGVPLCVLASPIFGITISVPPVAVSMRAAMRNRYGIKGSIAEDVAASCFCWWCAWCQMYRELKHRMKTPPAAMMMPTVPMMPAVPMAPRM